MNGQGIPVLASLANPALIAMLEDILREAKSGRIQSCAVMYSYGIGHIDYKINSNSPMELYLGCEMVRQFLFHHMTSREAPKIVRVAP